MVFWNLENFFDWKAEEGAPDFEFSSHGTRRWTRKRFGRKCDLIAKALLYIADTQGSLPDVVAFAEVENRFVLNRLIDDTPLRKLDYGIVHYDSPDPRGIDVALLYRTSRLDTVRTFPVRVPGVATRDMLVAQLRRLNNGTKASEDKGAWGAGTGSQQSGDGNALPTVDSSASTPGDSIAVIVCHHPSKYGGAASVPKREAAVARLAGLSDSLSAIGWRAQIAIGDFNDTPDSPIYQRLDSAFVNLASVPAAKGEGSIRFDGNWELIDQCFVSKPLASDARFQVCRIPFLTVRDSAHAGEKPLRTFSGPRYLGGVSDHCPIHVTIFPL